MASLQDFLRLPLETRRARLSQLTTAELAQLEYHWPLWARSEQLAPDWPWLCWVILAGRGWGKTRTGAEWVRQYAENNPGHRIALVAPTAADVRDVMVEGESGIINVCPPWFKPVYQPSIRRLTWPNGAMAITYSADEPERLRGTQHHAGWADELCAWRRQEAFDQYSLGLRLGNHPQTIVTTTPKPQKLIRDLIADKRNAVTRGSTFDNAANLSETFIENVKAQYEGTRLGRQEMYAEILDDVPGALWNLAMLEGLRRDIDHRSLKRIVVAVDPAVTSGADADETGIVVAGIDDAGMCYVLDDDSGRYTPDEMMRRIIQLYTRWEADRVIGEVNNGGDLIKSLLYTHDSRIPFTDVRATRGKVSRAEPVAALYEQKKVFHAGVFDALETQMCNFTVDFDKKAMGYSPDRVDALVWALTHLAVKPRAEPRIRFIG